MGADAVALATRLARRDRLPAVPDLPHGPLPGRHHDAGPGAARRLDVEKSAERYVRFYEATKRELEVFARINGRRDVHDLDLTDLVTLDRGLEHTNIEHA